MTNINFYCNEVKNEWIRAILLFEQGVQKICMFLHQNESIIGCIKASFRARSIILFYVIIIWWVEQKIFFTAARHRRFLAAKKIAAGKQRPIAAKKKYVFNLDKLSTNIIFFFKLSKKWLTESSLKIWSKIRVSQKFHKYLNYEKRLNFFFLNCYP